jgi:enoyl-CoA hydratase/carnithine racemase
LVRESGCVVVAGGERAFSSGADVTEFHADTPIERLAYGMLAQTADADEAARAFSEKREPHFRGR